MSFDFNNWQDWFRGKDNNQQKRDPRGYTQPNQNQQNYGYNERPNQYQGQKRTVVEEFQATGQNLVEQVQKLIHEGNVRRIRIKREGRVILDIPVVAAVIGGLLAPAIAAIGGIAAVVTNCTIEVTRDEVTTPQTPSRTESEPPRSRERYDDASYR